ncbi:MAG: hypothetical protein ACOY5B_18905, partial [Spirochaetota bacterium]
TEFAFNANLRYFSLDDLLPDSTNTTHYQLDDNWDLRGLESIVMHGKSQPLQDRITALEYEAKSLVEIKHLEQRSKTQIVKDEIAKEDNPDMAILLESEYNRLQRWLKSKPTQDERKKQRYYEALAEKVWKIIPTHGFIEIHELALIAKISGKHIFRLISVWTKAGLLETVDLNRKGKAKTIEYFDIRRYGEVLVPIRYTIKKNKIPSFNRDWRSKTRSVA